MNMIDRFFIVALVALGILSYGVAMALGEEVFTKLAVGVNVFCWVAYLFIGNVLNRLGD